MKLNKCWNVTGFILAITLLGLWAGSVIEQNQLQAKQTQIVQTEDFQSVQAAIDALPATGGVVELPAKTVEILEPLVVKTGDVLIRGKGAASHIKNINTNGKPALILSSQKPHKTRKGVVEPLWRIQLSNFRLTGNEKSGNGIQADFINELYLDGMTISYHGGHGAYLNFCFEDPRVNDCLLTYNKKSGVHAVGCHDTIVSATHFEENLDAVNFVDGFNFTATGNNLDDHLRHGFVVINSQGSTISSNMIEQCEGIGVLLQENTYATTVGANIFTADKKGGIVLEDVHGSTITGNTFTIQPIRAVSVDSKCRAITITGNTFANRSVGETEFRGNLSDNVASGIVLENTMLHTITGNTFSNLSRNAIELLGKPSQRILFSNNLLINTKSDHEKLLASEISGNLIHVDSEKLNSQKVVLPEKKKLHLYLLIGQSNMAGRGIMTQGDKKPKPGILSLNKKDQWEIARHPLHSDRPKIPGVGMGIPFALEMKKQNPEVIIGVIPCAVGGTPLSRWGKKGDLYQAALKRAKIAMKDGELKGIIWHQGEADCATLENASSYATRLKLAIESWRTDLNAPEIPFVVGELVPSWVENDPKKGRRAKVIEQLNSIPQLVPHTACTSAKGLKAKKDGVHFSRASLIIFGKRYAEEMLKLQSQKKSPAVNFN